MISRRNLLKTFALVPAAALVPMAALGEPVIDPSAELIKLLEARIQRVAWIWQAHLDRIAEEEFSKPTPGGRHFAEMLEI